MMTGRHFQQISHVLFDLDGTLLDSVPTMFTVYQEFLRHQGHHGTALEFDELNGPTLTKVVDILKARYDLTGDAATLLRQYHEMIDLQGYRNSILFPGARELITTFHGASIRMALITSAPLSLAKQALRDHGLIECFNVIVGAEDVISGKPDPLGYLVAIERLKAAPDDCIAIEDSPNGVQAAVQAGLRCIGVAHHNSVQVLDAAGACTVVASLDEIKRLLPGGC